MSARRVAAAVAAPLPVPPAAVRRLLTNVGCWLLQIRLCCRASRPLLLEKFKIVFEAVVFTDPWVNSSLDHLPALPGTSVLKFFFTNACSAALVPKSDCAMEP